MKIVMIGQKGIPTLFGGVERHVEEVSCRLAKKKIIRFMFIQETIILLKKTRSIKKLILFICQL